MFNVTDLTDSKHGQMIVSEVQTLEFEVSIGLKALSFSSLVML